MNRIVTWNGSTPKIHPSCFVAPDVWIIGDVEIEEGCTILFGVVIRGDMMPIRIGKGTNLQEHTMVHTTNGRGIAKIGENCTVGHRAIIHGCEVGDNCLIGMGSIILDDSKIGHSSIVGAGSLVTENKSFKERSLIIGSPAKAVRELNENDIKSIHSACEGYKLIGANLNKVI